MCVSLVDVSKVSPLLSEIGTHLGYVVCVENGIQEFMAERLGGRHDGNLPWRGRMLNQLYSTCYFKTNALRGQGYTSIRAY